MLFTVENIQFSTGNVRITHRARDYFIVSFGVDIVYIYNIYHVHHKTRTSAGPYIDYSYIRRPAVTSYALAFDSGNSKPGITDFGKNYLWYKK